MEHKELDKFAWAFQKDKGNFSACQRGRIFGFIGYPPYSLEQALKIYDLGFSDGDESHEYKDETVDEED